MASSNLFSIAYISRNLLTYFNTIITIRRKNELEKALNEIKLSNNKYQYRLKDLLGSGTSGCVYKAIDITDQTNKP